MGVPGQQSSDDEIYAWLISYIGQASRSVREVREGVIEISIDDAGEEISPRRVELLLTREALRSVAWSEWDIFDDSEPDVLQPASDPVRAGLDALTLYLDEALGTIRPDERYVVLHRGMFWGSVTPDVPPVRGSLDMPDIEPGSGVWSAYAPEDPRYGEPGSIFRPGWEDELLEAHSWVGRLRRWWMKVHRTMTMRNERRGHRRGIRRDSLRSKGRTGGSA